MTADNECGEGTPELPACTATLFLDYDGVLHPEYCPPHRFFEALPGLVSVLQGRPWVEWVVSSNWRYERRLPASGQSVVPDRRLLTLQAMKAQLQERYLSRSASAFSTPSQTRLDQPADQLAPLAPVDVCVFDRLVGITPLMPDLSRLPQRVLAYEREAQCLAWLRAWRPLRIHWLAVDDRPWLFSPFCPQLFQTNGAEGLQPAQLLALAERLDAMKS